MPLNSMHGFFGFPYFTVTRSIWTPSRSRIKRTVLMNHFKEDLIINVNEFFERQQFTTHIKANKRCLSIEIEFPT